MDAITTDPDTIEEFRRWIVLLTTVFFVILFVATAALMFFGDTVFL